ncbi:MAG: DUF1598 domain-containing protein [Planctomycetales bacterium]|nr:DUF1598 domain-containing protein [Planctomycetales bacterium]
MAGVEIDPRGVLRVVNADPRVTMARLQAARQMLPQNLARPSKMRKISLNRLEAAVADHIVDGSKPTAEMTALAGLTRLEYVFFYPDSGDIVIAGPAEGFGQDAVGRLVGIDSGKPCILLDDVIVALRAYAPSGDKTNTISVSIDPTQEGLARMQRTLQQLGSNFRSAADIPVIVNSLRQSLGLNEVTINGIPAGTHFAHVLTEADYRMKLIGIGLEAPPVPMLSYVARLSSAMTSSNALVRWFFVPDYEALAASEDGLAMKLVGQGVKLVGEDELVGADGSRKSSGRATNPASRAYTNEFTKKFRLISENSLVYSQLRNLVDLTIVAAYIQDRGFYEQSGWDLGVFANEDQLQVQVLPAPRQVETAINAVLKGSRLITPIGGGVTIQARNALKAGNVQPDDNNEIAGMRNSVQLESLAAGQWWWD